MLFSSKLSCLEWRVGHQKTIKELYQMYSQKQQKSAKSIICKCFRISEETYGVATSLNGVCSRKRKPHVSWISADKVAKSI
mmetsp:Transcript_17782/g.25118  ORF Transcript_17782/g.25118 Transcript_17782/m.25118 type:complete len:81 (+) Transcript_17782:171-413(+)